MEKDIPKKAVLTSLKQNIGKVRTFEEVARVHEVLYKSLENKNEA